MLSKLLQNIQAILMFSKVTDSQNWPTVERHICNFN